MLVGWGRQEVDAAVQAHEHLVVAHAQPVAVVQLYRTDREGRFLGLVDVDTVRARVLEPEHAAAVFNLAVMARENTLGIGQDPVVVRRTTDRPAIDAEDPRALLAQVPVVVADDAELDRHRFQSPSLPNPQPARRRGLTL